VEAGGTRVVVVSEGLVRQRLLHLPCCTPRSALGEKVQAIRCAVSHIPAVLVPSISLAFIILGAYASHPFYSAFCHIRDWFYAKNKL
jgi:hypothetical protein